MTFTEKAYAKINLDLYIAGVRPDGFHELSSVMATVSLADILTMTVTASEHPTVILSCDAGLPTDDRNLAYRAARLFLERSGIVAALSLTLEKHIPYAAGLAGGSSDAAAVLRLCYRAFPGALSRADLFRLAAEIGSDVAFCLHGGVARCTGRGEQLVSVAIPENKPLYAVLVKGNESVSTPDAFRRADALYDGFSDGTALPPHDADGFDAALRNGDVETVAKLSYNTFEDAIFPICPEAKRFRERLAASGAIFARMSGSGPTVYGIFDDKSAADEAKRSLGDLAILTAIQGAPLFKQ